MTDSTHTSETPRLLGRWPATAIVAGTMLGVGIFIVIFGLALGAAVIRHRKVRDGYFAALFLAVYFVSLQSESVILTQNALPWVLAVAAIVRLLTPGPAPAPRPRPKAIAKPAARHVPAEITVHA